MFQKIKLSSIYRINFFAFFFIYATISLTWSIDIETGIKILLQWMLVLFAYSYFKSNYISESTLKNLAILFMSLSFVFMILFSNQFYHGDRFGFQFGTLGWTNGSFLAIFFFIIAMEWFYRYKNIKNFFTVLLLSLLVILSMKKTAILALFLVLFLRKKLFWYSIVSVVLFFVLVFALNEYISFMSGDLFWGSFYGRFATYFYSVDLLKSSISNFIFGYGISYGTAVLAYVFPHLDIETSKQATVFHNEFLRILVEFGLVGFVLFWGYIFKFFYKLEKNYINQTFIQRVTYKTLFAFVIISLSENSLSMYYTLMFYTFMMIALVHNKKVIPQ